MKMLHAMIKDILMLVVLRIHPFIILLLVDLRAVILSVQMN